MGAIFAHWVQSASRRSQAQNKKDFKEMIAHHKVPQPLLNQRKRSFLQWNVAS